MLRLGGSRAARGLWGPSARTPAPAKRGAGGWSGRRTRTPATGRPNNRAAQAEDKLVAGRNLEEVTLAQAIRDHAVELITRVIILPRPQGKLAIGIALKGFSPGDWLRRAIDNHFHRLEKGSSLGALANKCFDLSEELEELRLVWSQAPREIANRFV